jgi:phosphopantetheinyl transferase (holo-ACP synthase)
MSRPLCCMARRGKELFAARHAKQILLTISHTDNYAAVVAILES